MKKLWIISRRQFLGMGMGTAAALVLGCKIPMSSGESEASATFQPNAFLIVHEDSTATVRVPEAEMGQGVLTALAMLIAEELEVDWKLVRVEQAPVDPAQFGNMSTGGSTSVRQAWEPLRQAGAGAREMLRMAAAQRWKLSPEKCLAMEGKIVDGTGARSLSYGELVTDAAAMPLPDNVKLKKLSECRLIGKPIPRTDTRTKTDGSAVFGIDIRRPGMLYAVVERCPVFGGRPKTVEAREALKVAGVRRVFEISTGVAVVADSTWLAMRGREALQVEWDEGKGVSFDDASIAAYLKKKANGPAAVARSEGDIAMAIRKGAKVLRRDYSLPFLAHAPMEPLNAVADVRKNTCEIWTGTQAQTKAQAEAAKLLGLKPDQVTVHETFLGGGFGRRGWVDSVLEAVEVSREMGAPVKLSLSREDDMRHGLYRPVSLHRMEASLDAANRLSSWHHRLVAPSIFEQNWPGSVKGGLDHNALDGAENLSYAIPNLLIEYVMANTPIPIMWWRSVYNSQNGFANEVFIDELATLAGKDPLEFRFGLLSKAPRLRRSLEAAAEGIGWGRDVAPGRGLGIACHASFGSFIAHGMEVEVKKDGTPQVLKVSTAVECGPVVNPDTVAAQMESAVIFGLSAAIRGKISIRRGAVVEGNWDDYEPLRMGEEPQVVTKILQSRESIGGIGEPGVPPVAPALVNAIAAATGKYAHSLPLLL